MRVSLKINKEKLARLAALEDGELWQVIKETAQKYGYTLPAEAPRKEDMQKIRSIMSDAEKISTKDILKLMSTFKAKKSKE